MENGNSNWGSLLAMFLLGSLIGAGIALLMAPSSGQETRSMIRDKGVELRDRAASTMEETRHKAEMAMEDMTSTAKDKANMLKDRAQQTMEQGRQAL